MKRTLLVTIGVAMLGPALLGACARDNATPPPLFGPRPTSAAPQAAPAPQTASVAPNSPLVGVWQGNVSDRSRPGAQMQNWRLELNGDGTYRSTSQFQQGGVIQHWGRYTVGDGFIRLRLMGWAPNEECGPRGCYALDMPDTDTVVVTAMDAQQIVTEQGTLARVQ
jgi:hypothetical protein